MRLLGGQAVEQINRLTGVAMRTSSDSPVVRIGLLSALAARRLRLGKRYTLMDN